jgi:hypothetical protein
MIKNARLGGSIDRIELDFVEREIIISHSEYLIPV